MMRRYWPRIFGSLKGFEKLSPMRDIITYAIGTPFGFSVYNSPEVIEALEMLKKAGEKSAPDFVI